MKDIYKNLKTYFKRRVISSSFFWKIRHIVQPGWIDSYSKSVKEYLVNFIFQNNILSVLDFGCASGSLLYDLKKKNNKLVCYGIDVNLKAIDACKNRFSIFDSFSETYSFNSSTDEENIKQFLILNSLSNFDLIVFDRVLYCLNEKEVVNKITQLSKFTKKIFIDDFLLDPDSDSLGYKHRDWIFLMEDFGFECEVNIPTIYSQVANANARTMVFKIK